MIRVALRRPTARLTRRHERWLYGVGAALFLSGAGWLVAHYFFAGTGEFGDARNASEPWWLRVHGAAAMAFLIAFGSLLPAHIVPAWRLLKNRRSGMLMIALVSVLVLTGYGLYYLGSEQTRTWISAVHWSVGIVCAGGLWAHVRWGKSGAKVPTAGDGPDAP